MKHMMTAALAVLFSLGALTAQVEAKPLGGGRTSGMKRQAPPPQPAQATPATPAATPGKTAAATAPAAAPAPVAPPKRSWMGPIAGLAAGLGIAALLSHFGMGEGMSSFFTMLLLAGIAFFAVRFLLQRFRPAARSAGGMAPQGMAYAGAGASAAGHGSSGSSFGRHMPAPEAAPANPPAAAFSGSGASMAAHAPGLPADIDTSALTRAAKLIFIRMQAANDAANLDDLRQFSTPEMFANFRLDLQDRQGAAQQTDVVQLDAELVEAAQEDGQQIVSVRFHGLMREEASAPALPFDEIWHLVKPLDGSREWAIAGIAQRQ